MAKIKPTVAMDVPRATAIAKRAEATPADLAAAIGAITAVDRLLAKNDTDASADLLEKILHRDDRLASRTKEILGSA